jgi:hypothetical protein
VPYLLLVFNLINILPSVLGISFDQILRFLLFMLFEVSICSNGMLHVHVYTCLNVFYSILFLVLNNDAISTSVVFLLTYKLKDLYRLLMLS